MIDLLFSCLPYALFAIAGAYLEAKFGGKVSAEVAVLKADLAAVKAKV